MEVLLVVLLYQVLILKLPDEGTAAKDAFQDSESFPPDEVADGSEVNMPGAGDTLFFIFFIFIFLFIKVHALAKDT